MQWFYEHYIVTSLVLLVFVSLFAVITIKVFFDPVEIPTGTVTAYGTFFGIGALIITALKLGTKRADNDNQ